MLLFLFRLCVLNGRGYAARARAGAADEGGRCWPLGGRPEPLPPMEVRRFRWWADEAALADDMDEGEEERRKAAMRRKRSVVELFAAVPRVAGDDGRKVKRKLDKGKQAAGAQAKKGLKKDKAPAGIAARKKVRFFFYQARICITWIWIGMRLLGILYAWLSGIYKICPSSVKQFPAMGEVILQAVECGSSAMACQEDCIERINLHQISNNQIVSVSSPHKGG